MIRHPSADAQQATVIKRQTWGGAPVLPGRRSRGCWNSWCIGFCQRFCKRVFQPPLQLRVEAISSHGCKKGCFQPPRPRGVARAGVPYAAIMPQGGWYGRTVLAMYIRSWGEDYEPAPYLTRRRGAPSGRYEVLPRRGRGTSRRAGRQGQRWQSPTGLPGYLAHTRSTGFRRATYLSGWRGCPATAVSPRSNRGM